MTLRPDDLPPDTPDELRQGLERLALRLEDERPYPSARFRSRLKIALLARPAERRWLGIDWAGAFRPAYGLAGTILLLVAGAGPAGLGPFAA